MSNPPTVGEGPEALGPSAKTPIPGEPADGLVLEPSEAMCDAARGLVMMDRFGLPNAATPLSKVAESGFYGELWRDVLDDDEREYAHRLPRGHLASLIWRAMEAVRLRDRAMIAATQQPAGEGEYEDGNDLHFAIYTAAYAILRDYDSHSEGDRGLIRAGDYRIPKLIAATAAAAVKRALSATQQSVSEGEG